MEGFIMNAMVGLSQKRLLRVGEAARILNVSRWTVYRWVEAGRLGGTRLGAGSLRIFSHTVAALIDLHYVGSTNPEAIERPEYSTLSQRSVRTKGISSDRSELREFATV
jgi:excisionase family DNA binding protein